MVQAVWGMQQEERVPTGTPGKSRLTVARVRRLLARDPWIGVAVVAAACVAIATVSVLGYRVIDAQLTDGAYARRAAIAQLAATALVEKFDRLGDIAVSLATRVHFRELVAEGRWTDAAGILRDVPRDLPYIERLFLADVNGVLRADVPALPGVRGRSFAHREWFKGVSRVRRTYVSPIYQRTAVPRLEVFSLASPIRGADGSVSGILVVQVRADRFFLWLREIEIGEGGSVYVVDPNGRATPAPLRNAQAGTVDLSPSPIVTKVLKGGRGVETAFDLPHQEDFLFAYSPAPGYGWGVIAQQPLRSAFAARNQQLRRLAVAYGLTALFCLLAAVFASWTVIARRQVEENRRARAELERRVAERTAQLEAANKELESFSYSVSHDLRSPLRAIDGFSRILQEDYGDRLDDEARRLLGVVRDNSRRMGELIDDLLEFSRLGRKALSTTTIDMNRLVERAVSELSPPGEKLPEVKVGALPPARGDPTLIKQAWVNLVGNAVKFSGKRELPVVEVSGYENGAEVVYCVRDNGAGFDMRYYDKLFGVFQRLHAQDEYPGTGVGLAIVQRVVARHGGRVWAEGREGEGAAFYFSLSKG